MPHMCRDCRLHLAEPVMLVCTGCAHRCKDCGAIGMPTIRMPACENSVRYTLRNRTVSVIRNFQSRNDAPPLYGFEDEIIRDDEHPIFQDDMSGIDCCWKWICRDGCLFTCQAPVTPAGVECENQLLSPPEEHRRTQFSLLIDQDGGGLLHCADCAEASVDASARIKNVRSWNEHCTKCNLPHLATVAECTGCCEDCGSTTNKFRWVPACSRTAAVWDPNMPISQFPKGCHWKRVCWNICQFRCSVCQYNSVKRGLHNPRGTSWVSYRQKTGDDEDDIQLSRPILYREPCMWRRTASAGQDERVYVCSECASTLPGDQLNRAHTWHDECLTARERWRRLRRNIRRVVELHSSAK
jgi:hypothetical protein